MFVTFLYCVLVLFVSLTDLLVFCHRMVIQGGIGAREKDGWDIRFQGGGDLFIQRRSD